MSRFLATVIQQFRNNVPEERGIERGFAFFFFPSIEQADVQSEQPLRKNGVLFETMAVFMEILGAQWVLCIWKILLE